MLKDKGKFLKRIKENITAFGFLTPALVLIAIFMLYPIGYTIYLSFFEWDALSTNLTYVGLDNYREMLTDEELRQVIWNTLIFTVSSVPATIALSLFLAVLLDNEIKGRGFLRTVFFSPVVTSFVAGGLIFVWMLNYDNGIVNYMLELVGIKPVNWLQSNGFWAMTAVVIMTIWKNAGYFMVIFLAGLQGIPKMYYEAGSLEGAGGGWKAFRHITWPLLKPTTLFVTVISLIFTFRTFEQIYVMTKGGPLGTTKVLVYYIYEQAFKLFNMGYAAAISIILLVLAIITTIFQFKLIGDENPEY
ncbi:sugar ABC transporter permease [Microaerobacter geothermalis]|uniref:carbohydrate ABC transporter permease n=1 Tax=Microaerobacter geothermalis TaxID=674972 RepID=UPI001F465C61|nr:sugar ABC transporter permease [Microaerobacter geothermalis]MCF6094248.1 sugar ABC transporter permease [Microaerobacter geothermalis]